MVAIRFISFVLVFVLLLLKESGGAHTDQAMKKTVATHASVEVAGRSTIEVQKVIYDGVPAGAMTEHEVGKSILRGRKSGLKKVEVSGAGASHSVEKCNRRRKGIVNVKCKLLKRNSSTSRKVKVGGFTAFSADYHVPKSHPPRNN